MKPSFISLCILIALLGSVSAAGTEMTATRVDAPPKIDGKLDDPCWKAATPITDFTVFTTDRRSDLKTQGFMAYDDANLYLAMNCLDPKPENILAEVSEDGEKVFRDDSVEIMIDPARSGDRYYQFVVAAGGGTFEVARAGGGAFEDYDWVAEWKAATSVNADGWSVEIAIPYYTLQITEDPGTAWGINFCRSKKFPIPGEQSATAERGIFNHAPGFTVARGIDADFSAFYFQVGPGEALFTRRDGKPHAATAIPITNLTGRRIRVKIGHHSLNAWRDQTRRARTVTLKPDASVRLDLEPQRLQRMIIGKSDRYFALDPPAREQIELTDATTGSVLARVAANLPLMCTAVHVRVKQTQPRVILEVSNNLADSLRKGRLLRVNVGLPGSLHPILTKKAGRPSARKLDIVFKEALKPGAYLASAAWVDKQGNVLVESVRPLTIQPPGAKVLNNFVTQLLDVSGDEAAPSEFTFFNPRTGWIFIRSTAAPAEGDLRLVLDKGPPNEAVITHKAGGSSTMEARRTLPAGAHTLQVHGGKLTRLTVRTMPEIIYPSGGQAKILDFGVYDWDFMEKHVHRNITTIRGGHDYEPRYSFEMLPQARAWKKAGGRWLYHTTVPGLGPKWKKELTGETAYDFWTDNYSFREPALDGHMADEINGGDAEMFKAWAEAVRWFSAEPKYANKVFIPWVAKLYGSEAGRLFMNVLLGHGRHRYAFKQYINDEPTLAEAEASLKKHLIDDVVGYTQGIEGGMEGMVVCFGIFTTPNESCNRTPGTNFKVFQDMAWNILANDPMYKGVGGVQAYGGSYCDPETHYWVNKLLRHYCIEGNTERATDDPYELPHIKHADYPDPAKGWTVTEAEPGATSVGRLPRYNHLLGAYGETAPLDNFLRMKRSAKGPNTFGQEIKQLEPGRLYSLKIIVADYNDINSGVSRKLVPNFNVLIDGTDIIEKESLDSPYVNNYGHAWRKFNRENRAHFIYVWRVFRAKGNTARLTVSDWKDEKNPGGPIGQELIYNFIQIQPYFSP